MHDLLSLERVAMACWETYFMWIHVQITRKGHTGHHQKKWSNLWVEPLMINIWRWVTEVCHEHPWTPMNAHEHQDTYHYYSKHIYVYIYMVLVELYSILNTSIKSSKWVNHHDLVVGVHQHYYIHIILYIYIYMYTHRYYMTLPHHQEDWSRT